MLLLSHKRNKVLMYAINIKLENTKLSKRSQTKKPHIVRLHLHEFYRIGEIYRE